MKSAEAQLLGSDFSQEVNRMSSDVKTLGRGLRASDSRNGNAGRIGIEPDIAVGEMQWDLGYYEGYFC
jgi:hypothetical protein